ncbi:MAG: hypothetical protein QNJ78_09445 [Gammaproteobacteria bacterium]|nr:hypothetical protein [Gammaproteobacteria bacterium]
MSRPLIIDKLNLRLPKGWRGDPTLLARQVAEQLQRQAGQLHNTERLDLNLRGHFAGDARRVAGQLGDRLQSMTRAGGSRRRGG